MKMKKNIVVEQELGIPPDYQLKALNSKNFFQANWHSNKLKVIRSIIKPNKSKRILDLGVGSGNLEFAFAHSVKEIVAIDYNDEAIQFLNSELKRRKIRNVKTAVKDIRELGSLKKFGKFDVITAIDVIEHVSLQDAKKFIKSLQILLNPGGVVCIITPNYKSTWWIIESLIDRLMVLPKLSNHQHLAKYNKKNLAQAFSDHGFNVMSMQTFNLFSFLFFNKGTSNFLAEFELRIPSLPGNLLVGSFTRGTQKSKTINKRKRSRK